MSTTLDRREVAAGYDRFYTTMAQQLGGFKTWREAKRAMLQSLQHWVAYGREHPGSESESRAAGVAQFMADVRKAKAFSDLRRSDGMRWLIDERRWVADNPPAKLVREAERIIRKLESKKRP